MQFKVLSKLQKTQSKKRPVFVFYIMPRDTTNSRLVCHSCPKMVWCCVCLVTVGLVAFSDSNPTDNNANHDACVTTTWVTSNRSLPAHVILGLVPRRDQTTAIWPLWFKSVNVTKVCHDDIIQVVCMCVVPRRDSRLDKPCRCLHSAVRPPPGPSRRWTRTPASRCAPERWPSPPRVLDCWWSSSLWWHLVHEKPGGLEEAVEVRIDLYYWKYNHDGRFMTVWLGIIEISYL